MSHVTGFAPWMVLEKEYTWNFRVTELNGNELRVSGLSGHSAFAVSKITVVRKRQDLIMCVRLALGRSGLRGDFDYVICLQPEIDRVLFGRDRIEIWRRSVEETRMGDVDQSGSKR
jgi:hypothetical protein